MSQTIEDLRATLFATLAGVKDGTVPNQTFQTEALNESMHFMQFRSSRVRF